MKLKYIILLPLVALWFVSGCTYDPYTGEKQASKAGTYGLGGAAVGAIIGASVGNSDDALKGALIGGAAGAGYGYYVDRQEKKLREVLLNTGVQVQRKGDDLKLIMPGDITFDVNQYYIRSSFYPTLNSIAMVIDEFNKTAVRVVGHTDSTGSDSHNQKLSEQRAQSVADYFTSRGVASGRIKVTGYGSRYSIADNASAYGRAKNRRVEIDLLPM